MSRDCAGCGVDITHKHKNAKYCTTECKDAVRFWGTYCVNCNEKLIVARANRYSAKYCSTECQSVKKRQNYLERNPNFNENYFAVPNLENSYWAGFIAADGCICIPRKGQKRLQIKLSSVDKGHLEKIQSAIGVGNLHDRQIFLKETQKSYGRTEYVVFSDKICDDLKNNFDIYPRKTLTHEPPNLTGDLAHAFIAGYIDGDGTYFERGGRLRISVLGTFMFLKWIAEVYGVSRNPRQQGEYNVHYINFYGDDAINVVRSFDGLNLPLLERKKNFSVISREEVAIDIGLVTDIEDDVYVSD